jgi:WAS/WASL-interacting protein
MAGVTRIAQDVNPSTTGDIVRRAVAVVTSESGLPATGNAPGEHRPVLHLPPSRNGEHRPPGTAGCGLHPAWHGLACPQGGRHARPAGRHRRPQAPHPSARHDHHRRRAGHAGRAPRRAAPCRDAAAGDRAKRRDNGLFRVPSMRRRASGGPCPRPGPRSAGPAPPAPAPPAPAPPAPLRRRPVRRGTPGAGLAAARRAPLAAAQSADRRAGGRALPEDAGSRVPARARHGPAIPESSPVPPRRGSPTAASRPRAARLSAPPAPRRRASARPSPALPPPPGPGGAGRAPSAVPRSRRGCGEVRAAGAARAGGCRDSGCRRGRSERLRPRRARARGGRPSGPAWTVAVR